MATNLLSTAELREAFFIELYKKAFPLVAHYVAKMGGTLQEAQDIFQDTLVIYYEKVAVTQDKTVLNEKAYVLGIAKNLWRQHFNDGKKIHPINDFDMEATTEERLATNKLLTYLETTGKKCMEMLKAYYYDRLPVDTVAGMFGYKGVRSATVAKFKCLEKVRETIKQKSLSYADFIE